ncbi:DUF7737 domain-containing protein [Streptomyces flavotricini]|uniref:DUF7737 domain-containing protein n=1 Tax=Streptomyces flavotricini TaxID=66888 RepID=UPI001E46F7F6|nr:hypothetical protein [Streptomyces flavotricini]
MRERLLDRLRLVGAPRTTCSSAWPASAMTRPGRGDQYLCIVAAGRTAPGAETGYLPFEGDRALALILGRAVMPADDTGITDPMISRQILRERA